MRGPPSKIVRSFTVPVQLDSGLAFVTHTVQLRHGQTWCLSMLRHGAMVALSEADHSFSMQRSQYTYVVTVTREGVQLCVSLSASLQTSLIVATSYL